ncbi:glycosyltransferase family 4 protein [Ectothiorhodospira haloalkaliphila]|uniref:glycosyltransferase family 4 protein n=1 Tax=Ectothiorhodospira haloalkaliphila TaxID=421628 RepID=UPI001EE864EE|nr:glycosyltransferase family 4 protein [Ectothiorhodospira haloalkaliphila]MCG5524336.1 glycosyltransferase family 4 protein [Ectothiorhodospira haloalkaliphila]
MLSDYDIVHVFSAINGNHRIIQYCRANSIKVVISPLIQPFWNKRFGKLAHNIERAVGWLTNWNLRTEYQHIMEALQKADAVVALGDTERHSIQDAFGITASKVQVIPNGIPERYFHSNLESFSAHYQIPPGFVLCVGTISPYKNQLAVAKALEDSGIELVLIGSCDNSDRQYLSQLKAFRHVRYIGTIDYSDPLLASAYSAASVFCLPSRSEVMPLSVLESLAAGTPVVMTTAHAMDTSGLRSVLKEVTPTDEAALLHAITAFRESTPTAHQCRSSVAHLGWDAVALELKRLYLKVCSDN